MPLSLSVKGHALLQLFAIRADRIKHVLADTMKQLDRTKAMAEIPPDLIHRLGSMIQQPHIGLIGQEPSHYLVNQIAGLEHALRVCGWLAEQIEPDKIYEMERADLALVVMESSMPFGGAYQTGLVG